MTSVAFVRSGGIDLPRGSLVFSDNANVASCSAMFQIAPAIDHVYNLNFYHTGVRTSSESGRSNGFPIRCLAY
ncbi:MAG: hypothetical protein K1W07_13145 [Parabacteroides distasonis]